MKEEILKLLRESDGFVSGQALCSHFGVSRTAVWKVVRQLIQEGYEIEAVNRKGYRLMKAPDVITASEIMSRMHTQAFGKKVFYYDEVGSTNNSAKLLAEQGADHGSLVISDVQTAGKGRRGRSWSSPSGCGIWMTLILRPDFKPSCAPMLTVLAAMAVYDALTGEGVSCKIKWPNDLIINGKKICGILTEMSSELDFINYVVVGMGINVHNNSFPENIQTVATSLALEGFTVRRSNVIQKIMEAFELYYNRFVKEKSLAFIKEEYNRRLIHLNKEVYIIDPSETRRGISRGIDSQGSLIVEIDGKEKHVMSGEVSVRGILGYT